MSVLLPVHVGLSLIGIIAGFGVVACLAQGQLPRTLNVVFLVTTLATSLTGFLFPIHGFTPALGLGVISIVDLAIAFYALYGKKLSGSWSTTFAITAVAAQYFNYFVLIVQAFQKVEALHMLAPTQKEPPFIAAQVATLGLFVWIAVLAVRRFGRVES
ncbi:MAG TPA: hypothetical protein VHD32_08435 [Candidatus Didemnitutus sp.]|nr:hypothetical protein [Candidatus Didemnitutus sp.]